jgi:hypothetical protein
MDAIVTTAFGLPRSLEPFFQEYDFERVDPEEHGELVIERTLAYGDRRELRWLFERYSRDRLRDWVRRMGWRRLPRRRFNLWCVLLNVDDPQRPAHWQQRIWPH